jgi:hypothetical protein
MCTAEDLGAVHVGRPEPDERRLLGHVLLTNQAARGCILYGWAQSTELLDPAGRVLPLEHRANGDSTPSSFVLAPGQAARMEVWWQNWCQPAPEGPLSLVVSPSRRGGKLAVPLEGSAPECIDPTYPSFLLVGPFQRWE